jgi:N-acetyl-gamma-glutamyl-phosphate reductase
MHMVHARVALFGAAGYSGLELVKLLALHPDVHLVAAATDTHAGKPLEELVSLPRASTGTSTGTGQATSFVRTEDALTTPADIALLAVPPEAAAKLTPVLRAAGTKVVDLSHAFRASAEATYGLSSLFASEIAAASIIANPGCYATCVITALAPLVRHGLIERDVIVSAGSGVTGAGKSAVEAMSLGEMDGNVRAYKVLRHQHVPEIEMALARVAARTASAPKIILTTHLLPVARGIFATITVKLTKPRTTDEIAERMRGDYAADPTVVVAPTAEDVSLRKVVGTNQCHVGVAVAGEFAVVTAALDNLVKGAAGQAVENMNLVLGLPRTTGLLHLARHG